MEAIAAAAEVSIGTIYNYYQNKDDLYLAIQTRGFRTLREGQRVAFEVTDGQKGPAAANVQVLA